MSMRTLTLAAAPRRDAAPMPVSRTSTDEGVTKFCLRTWDGHDIESVLIPMGAEIEGADKTWQTLCLSSQIGCARGCTFCYTAKMGLVRNLTAAEILDQLRAAREHFDADVRNVVFMGMGEPLDNLDEVLAAIRTMTAMRPTVGREAPIARRRVTVSTVGKCAGIQRLARLGWRRLKLAVSLNAPNDTIRSQLMPINRLEPMSTLREAIAAYPVRAGGHVLIEYVLIKGVNDAPTHARELVEYLDGLRTCVNLIPWNPCADLPYETPEESVVEAFHRTVMEAGQMVFCRRTRGRQAMAACGQLGRTV